MVRFAIVKKRKNANQPLQRIKWLSLFLYWSPVRDGKLTFIFALQSVDSFLITQASINWDKKMKLSFELSIIGSHYILISKPILPTRNYEKKSSRKSSKNEKYEHQLYYEATLKAFYKQRSWNT